MQYTPNQSEKELFYTLTTLKNVGETKKFLRDLLTEAELKEFANRWKVARMLEEKVAYKDIEKQTGMSSTTIARIQKWLTKGMGGYRLMLNRIATHHATPPRDAAV